MSFKRSLYSDSVSDHFYTAAQTNQYEIKIPSGGESVHKSRKRIRNRRNDVEAVGELDQESERVHPFTLVLTE